MADVACNVLYDNILRRSRFLKADFFLFICIPELVLNFYKKAFCNFFSLAAEVHCGLGKADRYFARNCLRLQPLKGASSVAR
jgi:hypothetical protein